MNTTATISKTIVWDDCALIERVKWEIKVSDGRTKRTPTRREAREWCAEMNIEVTK